MIRNTTRMHPTVSRGIPTDPIVAIVSSVQRNE
jgi:hypothetical protein